MTESEIKAYIEAQVAAQLQAITSKDIASESDVPTLSDAEWDTNNSITSLPVVYNGSAWRKIGAGFLRTLRNAAAVINTAWNALKNNGTSVSWIPTVDSSGNAGKTSPADLAAVLGVNNEWGNNCYTIDRSSGIKDKKVKLFTLGSYAVQTYYMRICDVSLATQPQAIVTFINRNTAIYTNVLCKYGSQTLKLYAKKDGNNMIIYTDLAGISYPVICITRLSYSIGDWNSRFNMKVDDDADISSMIDISI